MKHLQILMTLVVIVFLAAACGAPAGGNLTAPESTATPVAAKTSQAPSPTVTPTEAPPPFLSAPGVGSLKLLTGTEGAGEKPLFAWGAVPGAQRYQLIVFDETGAPYWAWEGMKSQIYIGGTDSQPPADGSGPSIGPGYTWAVVAYDPTGGVVAASEIRPISP